MSKGIRSLLVLMAMTVFAGDIFAAHTITTWPDNKTGAVSLTFDDGMASQQTLAIPALDARGMKGTFFVITDKVAGDWGPWMNAAVNGHEIGSHTLSHPYLTLLTPTQAQVELQSSQSIIDNAVTSQKAVTLAYPYGDYNSSVQSIARNYYIAARGVNCGLNYDPIDFYGINACSPDSLDDVYLWTDAAQTQGAWMVFFAHSLDGTGYGDWLIGDLTNYLDYLKTKNLWVGTFGSMVKYIKERQSANLFVSSATASQIVLNLTDTLDDAIFGEPLTIRSELPGDWTNVTVLQGGNSTTVASVLEGGVRVIYYHATPDRGPITLTSSSSPGNVAPNGVIDTPTQNVSINMGDSVPFTGTGTDPDGNLPLSYRWSFGTGSGIPDATVEDPGGKQFNNAGTFSVTFTVTDALGLSDPTPATRVITGPWPRRWWGGSVPSGRYRPGFHGIGALSIHCFVGRLRLDARFKFRLLRHRRPAGASERRAESPGGGVGSPAGLPGAIQQDGHALRLDSGVGVFRRIRLPVRGAGRRDVERGVHGRPGH